MDGGHHGLAALVQGVDQRDQVRLAIRLFLAELVDIGTARKSLAGTRDDDGLDGRVGIGLVQPLDDAPPRG